MDRSDRERGTIEVHLRNVLCEIYNYEPNGTATIELKLKPSPEFINVVLGKFPWIPKDKARNGNVAVFPQHIETMSDFTVRNPECMKRIDSRVEYQSYHCRELDLLWIPVTMEVSCLEYQMVVRNWRLPDVVHAKYAGNTDLGFVQWNWSEDKLVSTHPEYKKLLDQKLNEEK